MPPPSNASHADSSPAWRELAVFCRPGPGWHLRVGDWLVLALGAVAVLAALVWRPASGFPSTVVVRAGAAIYAELDPRLTRRLEVPGPLGTTVVEITQGRARIARDPSPRQICVQQGWLSSAGEHALCLPNQVSVELVGSKRRHDTLAY